jgi:transcriptional regulator with XRE-family HTH domain
MPRKRALLARISARLRDLRGKRGLSVSELADRAGLHEGLVERIDAGERLPPLEALLALAEALGVEPFELV